MTTGERRAKTTAAMRRALSIACLCLLITFPFTSFRGFREVVPRVVDLIAPSQAEDVWIVAGTLRGLASPDGNEHAYLYPWALGYVGLYPEQFQPFLEQPLNPSAIWWFLGPTFAVALTLLVMAVILWPRAAKHQCDTGEPP
jgi:hypothetical protein